MGFLGKSNFKTKNEYFFKNMNHTFKYETIVRLIIYYFYIYYIGGFRLLFTIVTTGHLMELIGGGRYVLAYNKYFFE